jgi:hypothetical protein
MRRNRGRNTNNAKGRRELVSPATSDPVPQMDQQSLATSLTAISDTEMAGQLDHPPRSENRASTDQGSAANSSVMPLPSSRTNRTERVILE